MVLLGFIGFVIGGIIAIVIAIAWIVRH